MLFTRRFTVAVLSLLLVSSVPAMAQVSAALSGRVTDAPSVSKPRESISGIENNNVRSPTGTSSNVKRPFESVTAGLATPTSLTVTSGMAPRQRDCQTPRLGCVPDSAAPRS